MSHDTSPRPSAALAVAVLALVVALCGTAAYAATALPKNSVGAAQLKKNAVKSRAVANGSLKAKDFKTGQLGADVFVKNVGGSSVTVTAVAGAPPDTVVASASLPAGSFYVRASVYGINQHGALQGDLRCFLKSTGDVLVAGTPGLYALLQPNGGSNINRAHFSLDAAYKLKNAGTVTVECNKEVAGQTIVAGASISAMRARKVTTIP